MPSVPLDRPPVRPPSRSSRPPRPPNCCGPPLPTWILLIFGRTHRAGADTRDANRSAGPRTTTGGGSWFAVALGWTRRLGFASDIGGVRLIDQVRTALPMPKAPGQERHPKLPYLGDALRPRRLCRRKSAGRRCTRRCPRAPPEASRRHAPIAVRTSARLWYRPSGPSVMAMWVWKSSDREASAVATPDAHASTRCGAGAARAYSSRPSDSRSSARRCRTVSRLSSLARGSTAPPTSGTGVLAW